MIQGHQCRVLPYSLKFAKMQSKSGDQLDKGTYVFVKGFLRSEWNHSDLHKVFESIGPILSAKVSIDKNHRCKGYGYI